MKLFETYFKIKDKKPAVRSFSRPKMLDNLEQAQTYEDYAGRLAPDTLLIDIDDKEQAECMMKIVDDLQLLCQVRETDRGMHFYFKNNGRYQQCETKSKTAIGFTVDVKTGIKNSYAVLKNHGKEREIIYDILKGEDYQEAPRWLTLLPKGATDAWKIDKGNRNDALYSYQIQLINAGLSRDECRECTRLINKYVLKKPLSDDELEVILRDEAYEKLTPSFFSEKGAFLHRIFADYVIRQFHLKRINGELYLYFNNEYLQAKRYLGHVMRDVIKDLKKAQKSEAEDCLKDLLIEDVETAAPTLIKFRNGILNVETGELLPNTPDFVITNAIPWDYRTDTETGLIDKALLNMSCGDKEKRAMLEEIAGYTFFRRNELRKAFILAGQPVSGKSTYLRVIEAMIGKSNVSNLSLADLNERFKPVQLANKLVNLGDDISEKFIDDTSVFKKVVSGEPLEVEYKGQDSFSLTPYAKFIFSVNEMPRIKDTGGGALNRIVFVPFNANLKENPDFDPFIEDKLKERKEIERFIWLAVEGLKRVLKQQGFTHSAESESFKDEYMRDNDPFLDFISDYQAEDFCRESVGYWYEKYQAFCISNSRQALNNRAFGRRLCATFALKSKLFKVKGETVRRYAMDV